MNDDHEASIQRESVECRFSLVEADVVRLKPFRAVAMSRARFMPHLIFQSPVYNRRKSHLKLRLIRDGQTFVVSTPNPAAKMAFPVWSPQPLPQTRRSGELDVVLQSLDTFQANESSNEVESAASPKREVSAKFEILHHGTKANGVEILPLQLSDATGNQGNAWIPPPSSEPAWKVRLPFIRTPDFPFTETDGVVSGPWPIPGTGKYEQLPQVAGGGSEPHHYYAALLGPGHYVWQENRFMETGNFLSKGELEVVRRRVGLDPLIFNYEAPCVVLIAQKDVDFSDGTGWVIRARWSAQDHRLTRAWSTVDFPFRNGVVPPVHCYRLTEDGVPSPPPGTLIEIQIIMPKIEYADFFVEPPIAASAK